MTRMADVQHTNPNTGETFVATFQRGIVAADGGEAGAGPPTGAGDTPTVAGDTPTASRRPTESEAGAPGGAMADVAHESTTGGANRSFERGVEGRADRV